MSCAATTDPSPLVTLAEQPLMEANGVVTVFVSAAIVVKGAMKSRRVG